MLRVCARTRADDAALVIVNSTVETLDAYVWLPFFPSALAIDRARLPTRARVAEAGRAAGLTVQRARTVVNPVAESLRASCAREDHGKPVMDAIDVVVLRKPAPDQSTGPTQRSVLALVWRARSGPAGAGLSAASPRGAA